MAADSMSRDPDGINSDALLSRIATPHLAAFGKRIEAQPTRYTIAFSAVMVAWTFGLLGIDIYHAQNDVLVSNLPNPATMALVVGVCIFPLHMIAVPVAVFLLGFFGTFAIGLVTHAAYIPQSLGLSLTLVVMLAFNLILGIGTGLLARTIARRMLAGPHRAVADLWQGSIVSAVFLTVAPLFALGVLVWLMNSLMLSADDRMQLAYSVVFRTMRGGLSAGLLLLLFREPARSFDTVAFLVVNLAFLVLALLEREGIKLEQCVDVLLLALGMVLLFPGYTISIGAFCGTLTFAAVTGTFIEQETVVGPEKLALEVTSIVLFVFLFVAVLTKVRDRAMVSSFKEMMQRYVRIQKLSSVGYFVRDNDTGMIFLDDPAQRILDMPATYRAQDILHRIHKMDRRAVSDYMAERKLGPNSLSYRLASAPFALSQVPPGADDVREYRTIRSYYWNDRLFDGRVTTFGMVVDVTVEHETAEALRQTLAALSDRQDRQTQLFSMVSHELRTPAAIISMLSDELDAGADWSKVGPQMHAVSDQLLSILTDMRQTVRPEENLPVSLSPVRARDLAETLRNTFALLAQERGIAIVLNLSGPVDQPRMTDRMRLVQAMSNLIKNAILHASATRITISYAEDMRDGTLTGLWQICDNGENISADALATLFEPFSRARQTVRSQADGTGLGLFVSKTSIEVLGGTLEYVPNPASGAIFQITVPLTMPVPQDAPVPATPAVRDLSRMSVLLVEDSEVVGEVTQARLERLFGSVEWVKSGAEGLEAQERLQPDIILSDLVMPGMNGDEMAYSLRQRGVRIPIIGVTAAAIGDERQQFIAAGADEVLIKPVSMDKLTAALERVWDNAPRRKSA